MSDSVFMYTITSGVLGAFASYLLVMFHRFESLPATIPDQSKNIVVQRLYFLAARLIFGIATAIIFLLLSMDSYLAHELSKYKLYAHAALAAFGVTSLSHWHKFLFPKASS